MDARTRTRQSRAKEALSLRTEDIQRVELQMAQSMDRLFLSIAHLDDLMGKVGSRSTDMPSPGHWLNDLRAVRDELDDVLIRNDQVRELLSTVSAIASMPPSPPVPLDLNRSLARVAYVTRALVPDQLQIVERLETVPVMFGSPHVLKQSLIQLVSLAARAIDEQGVITLGSQTRAGLVELIIEARPAAILFDAKVLAPLPDSLWSSAVAALAEQGAEVSKDDRHDGCFCIRITWPRPMSLLG